VLQRTMIDCDGGLRNRITYHHVFRAIHQRMPGELLFW
jgi:hypothetical protein